MVVFGGVGNVPIVNLKILQYLIDEQNKPGCVKRIQKQPEI